MHGGLGICRGFPAVSVTDSQKLVSSERVPSLVVPGMATVNQVVRAPGVSSLILVTDGSGEVTFIDGRHITKSRFCSSVVHNHPGLLTDPLIPHCLLGSG